MLQAIRTRFPWLPATALLGAALLVVPAAMAKSKSPAYPPGGKTLKVKTKDWVPRWWEWAYSMPETYSPLYDEAGDLAGLGQRGGVWFLAGAYNLSGTVSRDVVVPEGVSLFFPVLAIEDDDLGVPARTLEDLQASVAAFADAVDIQNAFCIVDGVPLTDLVKRRVQATTFSYFTAPDTIPYSFGLDPGDLVAPVASDGYWVMLRPLDPATTHTLHFGGHVGGTYDFDQDITYNVTVRRFP